MYKYWIFANVISILLFSISIKIIDETELILKFMSSILVANARTRCSFSFWMLLLKVPTTDTVTLITV